MDRPLYGKNKFFLIFFILFSVLCFGSTDKTPEEYLVGKYNPADYPADFQTIPSKYALQSTMYMQKDALKAFIEMAEAAQMSGFNIFIVSSLRNFYSQKYIWESKFNGQRLVEGKNLKKAYPNEKKRALKILEYSSMPGTSRHHWGTDIDIGYDIKNAGSMLTNEAYEKGKGKKFYNWMLENAERFGFCQPYKDTPQKRNSRYRYGYQEEKWHWSYKPLAKKYLAAYVKNAKKFIPAGFSGSRSVKSFFLDYVENIHKDCQ